MEGRDELREIMLKAQEERQKRDEQRFCNIIAAVGTKMSNRAKEGHDHVFIEIHSIYFDDGTGSPIRYALNDVEVKKLVEFLNGKGYQVSLDGLNNWKISWYF